MSNTPLSIPNKKVYLDHAGATLPSPQLMQDITKWLTDPSLCLANPHSRHASGQFTANVIQIARQRVLAHFNVSSTEYAVIFTANATSALKLLAESYSFDYPTIKKNKKFILADQMLDPSVPTLMMLQDSHTSVIGMRNTVDCEQVVVLKYLDCLKLEDVPLPSSENESGDKPRKLFVLTAMSNFCGCKYDLRMVRRMQEKLGWSVCLDAAALAGCNQLDLQQAGMPHFVAVSFYKMFGYPTGLGALLVHREHAHLLHKTTYFGGGSVDFASHSSLFVQYRQDVEARLEDGTLDFYSIATLQLGLKDLQRWGGMAAIEQRCFQLALTTTTYLRHLQHANGSSVAVVYGWKTAELRHQGPIVNFNLLRPDKSWVGYVEVEKMADLFGLEMRTGCFCNQGACAMHLGLEEDALKHGFESGKVCGDELDLGEDGRPLGSVRLSFGRTSTEEDIKVFQQMIECCFVSHSTAEEGKLCKPRQRSVELGRLTYLFLYPIKSCGAIEPTKWKLSASGLQYDRQWMVVSGSTGVPLTQKRFPVLCQITPKIDEKRDKLVLEDRLGRLEPLEIALTHILTETKNNCKKDEYGCSTAQVCTNSYDLVDCGSPETCNWLSDLHPSLHNNDCRLVGRPLGNNTSTDGVQRSFSNQGEYLLVTRGSIQAIAEHTGLPWQTVMRRFRPNIVVDIFGAEQPFQEDNFRELHFGSLVFEVTGLCTRCQMVCIDQETGEKDPNLLLSLRELRQKPSEPTSANSHRLTFGVYLSLKKSAKFNLVGFQMPELRVGSPAKIIYK